jgi:hypothetical protein
LTVHVCGADVAPSEEVAVTEKLAMVRESVAMGAHVNNPLVGRDARVPLVCDVTAKVIGDPKTSVAVN